MRIGFLALVLFIFCAAPLTAAAQGENDPETVLERLFQTQQLEEEWFTQAFLDQVPIAQVSAIVSDLEQQFGAFQSVAGAGESFTVSLEEAEVPTRLTLDSEGRIAGLFLEPPIAAGTLSAQIQHIATLPGDTAVLVTRNGEPEAQHNAEEPLAVGSSAKLAILKAVTEAVEAGDLQWDQVVPLAPEWRSLPTGILQDWSEDSPLTLSTLAGLMISMSDNTATDALIDLAGRDAVATETPRNAPFPTTAELFKLKAKGNADLRRAWTEGDEAARREVLNELAPMPLPQASEMETDPSIEVEWFLSANELCTLMAGLADLPAFRINPGLAEAANWQQVAYKGGSEAGVLNFTMWLEDGEDAYCVSATWNNADSSLDTSQLVSRYRAILRILREGD